MSDNIPWSGWWWPTRSGGLATGTGYRGSPSPLEKYDLITSNRLRGPATNYYLNNHYNPEALPWHGLCDAWAAAAIREPIDFVPSTVDNLVFRIGDKKGLMTYAYELSFMTDQYQTMDDPLVLHTWLQQYIRDQGTAFVAELDPSEELWNYPVYKYEMTSFDFGDEEQVTCTIWYADDNVSPDFSGTRERQKTYRYTLYKSGNTYVSSEWGLQNTYDHPSRVYFPESARSRNPHIDYDTVKEMAESRDDELDHEQPVSLIPGTYNLILLDRDRFVLGSSEEDLVSVSLLVLDDTQEPIHARITDAAGMIVYQGDIDQEIFIPLHEFVSPFTISISKASYDNPGIYQLAYEVQKTFEFVRPKAQKGFGWGGYAVVNSTDTAIDDIMVSGYDSDGKPVDTFLGPFSLAAGKKQMVLSDEFPFRNQLEKESFYGIKIHAPGNVDIVNLSGVYQDSMASFSPAGAGSRLVIPEYPEMFDFNMTKTWGIYNPGFDSSIISMSLYSMDGQLEDTTAATFDPRQIKHFKASSAPFTQFADNGWVLVESDRSLSGYEEWLSRRNDSNEVIPALVPGSLFYLPNPVEDNTWQTTITVINVSNIENTITFSLLHPSQETLEVTRTLAPYEKIKASLPSLFPGIAASSVMKLSSSRPVAGFYTYSTLHANDMIAMPFTGSNDIDSVHTVPHVASNADWWTGLVLCNTGDETSFVRLLPFDTEGQEMAHAAAEIELLPNQKYSTLVSQLFDPLIAATLSHIRIEVTQGSPVFGTYGYGTSTMKMLTGLKL